MRHPDNTVDPGVGATGNPSRNIQHAWVTKIARTGMTGSLNPPFGRASMRTTLSLSDLAVLTALFQKPLAKLDLARRALALGAGPTFDRAVALATVDRLVGLRLVRKIGARYELSQEGREATVLALRDHRAALDQMAREVSPRLVEETGTGQDARGAA